jgi:hypothetical protein
VSCDADIPSYAAGTAARNAWPPRGSTCGASSRRIGSVAFAPSDTDVLEHSCKIRSWREITPDGFKYSQPEGRQKGCWLMSPLWPRPQQLGWGSFFCGRTISLAN